MLKEVAPCVSPEATPSRPKTHRWQSPGEELRRGPFSGHRRRNTPPLTPPCGVPALCPAGGHLGGSGAPPWGAAGHQTPRRPLGCGQHAVWELPGAHSPSSRQHRHRSGGLAPQACVTSHRVRLRLLQPSCPLSRPGHQVGTTSWGERVAGSQGLRAATVQGLRAVSGERRGASL